MRRLSDSELLGAWERGHAEMASGFNVLAVLAAAIPTDDVPGLARMTVGRRDALLFELRESIFGSQMRGIARCASCGHELGIALRARDFRPSRERDLPEVFTIRDEGYELTFRLINTVDLVELGSTDEIEIARAKLLRRTILSAYLHGEAIEAGQVPCGLLTSIEESMAELEPEADVELATTCDYCSNSTSALLDIATFLWTEVDRWAIRTLREIHTLAEAYGWRESDILAISPWRRRCYLEMVGA